MFTKIIEVAKKAKRILPPPEAKSLDEVITLFKQKGVNSVIAEVTLYKRFLLGYYKITVDYTGVSEKKVIRRQEVLKVIKGKASVTHLLDQVRELHLPVRDRAKKMEKELGVSVSTSGNV